MPKFNQLTINEIGRKLYNLDSAYQTQFGMRIRLLKLYLRLSGTSQELARYGIERHIYYCDKGKLEYDIDAIREIMYDAMAGISFALEMQREAAIAKQLELPAYCLDLFSSNRKTRSTAKTPAAA